MKQKLKKLLSVENASKVFVMMLCVGAMNITANAADSSTVVTNAFSSFLSVIKSIISCIGIIVILWGVFEMGTAMQGMMVLCNLVHLKGIGRGSGNGDCPPITFRYFPGISHLKH